jgi:iron complex transport system ATP-binding protein
VSELQAMGLTVRRGGRAILDDVSFAASSGECVAVIGPNGAGKSTLLAALAGLLSTDGGSVRLDGQPVSQMPRAELAKRRAYLPQNPRCEWPIPVERLVALGLTPELPPFGDLPPAHRAHVDATIDSCDLNAHRLQAATTLSGGELARAMLARALVGNPEILIVDEPMAGLDPRHVLDAAARLSAFAKRDKLVVAAVHDLTLAARFATRIVMLHQGRVAADGTPQSTLTPDLVRSVFAVEARISHANGVPFIDYLAPS